MLWSFASVLAFLVEDFISFVWTMLIVLFLCVWRRLLISVSYACFFSSSLIQSSSPLLGHSVLGKYHGYGDGNVMSPRNAGPQSPSLFPQLNQQVSANSNSNNGTVSEIQRLRDELNSTKSKMAEWEGVYNQAKCVSWTVWIVIPL